MPDRSDNCGHANESELRMAVVRKFKEADIEIPFPQREIRIVRGGPDDPATASPPTRKDKEDKAMTPMNIKGGQP